MSVTTVSIVSEARRHRERGFGIVWLMPGERMPKRSGWTEKSQEPDQYSPGANLGLMTGWVSGNLVCADLDTPDSIALAEKYLPSTRMIDGRPSKPKSHWWYIVTDIPDDHISQAPQASAAAIKLGIHPGPKITPFATRVDGKSKEILSLRGTGTLATIPPSIVSNEERIWYADGDPLIVPYTELYERSVELATACGWIPKTAKMVQATRDLRKIKAVSGEGGRNSTWHSIMLVVNGYYFKFSEVWQLLKEWNEEQDPPWSDDELWQQIEKGYKAPVDWRFPRGAKSRPLVQVTPREIEGGVELAIDALKDHERVYCRGQKLVHVIEDDEGSPVIRIAETPFVKESLSSSAQWAVYDPEKKRQKAIAVPDWVVKGVEARGWWPSIRFLKGVTTYPVLRADGSVLSEAGYDPDTCLIYRPSCEVSVPDAPSREDGIAGANEVLEVVQDFPFRTPADRSAFLAAVLTVLSRHAFEGPTPLFLFDANTPGTGKTLLAELVLLITLGKVLSPVGYSDDDVEMRKLITSELIAGSPVICFDNVSGNFGCPSLDRVLTSTSWTDRRLGKNEIVTVPQYSMWMGTSNNAILAGDMHRRITWCRMETPLENPEDRSDFKIKYVDKYVVEHRGRLLSAALTLLRAYVLSGEKPELARWGRFEGWSNLVRRTIVWAGFADPSDTRKEARKAPGSKLSALAAVLYGIRELCEQEKVSEVSTDAILKWCGDSRGEALKEGLRGIEADVEKPRSVGKRLGLNLRRVVDGVCLHMRTGTGRVTMWRVGPPETGVNE